MTLSIIYKVNIIDSKKFAKLVINKRAHYFVIYARQVIIANKSSIYRNRRSHIARVNLAVTDTV